MSNLNTNKSIQFELDAEGLILNGQVIEIGYPLEETFEWDLLCWLFVKVLPPLPEFNVREGRAYCH